jgi:DNA-binding PadR family transcriptional regulator
MRHELLALLAAGPAHGYELKGGVELARGRVSQPLNIGQIYTTLGRLERDLLVEAEDAEDDGRPKRVYRLTDAGRKALESWIDAPTEHGRLKDEFFQKLMLVASLRLSDPLALIDRQRAEYLRALREVQELALHADDDLASELLLEGASLHLQADLKWLDTCEQRIREELIPQ